MESESDTENEQLQHDILQIHEVLGQGEDGDDSDWELEIDDTKEADDDNSIDFIPEEGFIETSESRSYELSSLLQPIDRNFSPTTPENQPSTSEECSLELLLLINQESQRKLQELLFRVAEELERNQDEQVKVSKNPTNREEKNVDLSIMGLFRDYMELFQDSAGKKPPRNEDTKQRMSGDKPSPFEFKQKKWSEIQRESLLEAVKTDGRKRAMQPLLNRREILEMKMDRLSVPHMMEKVYIEIENNKEELIKTESIPSEELIGDRFREVDWDTTANVYLEADRSAKECQLQWQNLLHPSISRKKWTAREKAELTCIAAKHRYRDWETIAEELGTGRSALQCLRAFQLQDKNFVKPTFTDEEDALLLELAQHLQVGKYIPFPKVAYFMEGHTQLQVLYRWMRKVNPDIKTGKFSQEEDNKLKKLITVYGAKNWARLAELMPGRTQFQIRHRWMTVLSPSIKLGPWDYQETMEFLQKVKEHGVGNWSKIAAALHKNQGQKGRTSYHLLQRFKNLVASYMTWRNNSSDQLWKIDDGNEEDLFGNKLADKLLLYLPLKQKAKEESMARRQARKETKARKELGGVRVRRKWRRKRKVESDDDEDDEDDEEDEDEDEDDEDYDDYNDEEEVSNSGTQFLSQEQHLTARQKALAQRKEMEQETFLVRQKCLADELETKNSEKSLRRASKQLIMSKLDNMDRDIVSEQEEDEGSEDVDPYDARNEDDDDGVEINHGAGSSSGTIAGRIQKSTVSNHLSGLLQKLKEREAAQKETQASKDKKSWIDTHAGLTSANCDPDAKGMPRWMEKLKCKERCATRRKMSGRKPYSEIDMELVKAVDPMWIYQGKGSGRQRRQQLGMQKRTRQEKLSPNDQKMMFKLLLKVLDVDIEYASTKVRFSLQVPSEVSSRSQKTLPVIPTTQGTSDEATTVCQNADASAQNKVNNIDQGVTSDPKAMTSGGCEMIRGGETTKGSQALAGFSQPVTSAHQEVTSGLPRVINGPQPIAGGLPVVAVGPKILIGNPGVLAHGSPAVATSPFPVQNIPFGVNTGPLKVTGGRQFVTFGPQTLTPVQPSLITAPQGVTSGPHPAGTGGTHSQNGGLQAVTIGPRIQASYPQAVATSPQAVASGLQAVAGSVQTVASCSQAVTSIPQAVASGPQAVTNVSQAVASCSQALTSIQQAIISGPQAVTSVSQAVANGPQAVASGPQAVASGPQAVASGHQAVTNVPQAVASGLQAIAGDIQAVASGPQAVESGPQAVTNVPQAVASGLQAIAGDIQAVASGPQAVESGPQAVTNVPQAVASGLQAIAGDIQAVASGPQAVASGPQAVASGPQAVASGPQTGASGPEAVTDVHQALDIGLQALASRPQSVASVQQAETSNLQGFTSDMRSHQISTKTLSQNVIPPTIPSSTTRPENATKDGATSKGSSQRKRGRSLSVRQQLELQRSKLAQTASSSPETPLLSSPSNQVSLPHNSPLSGISSPTHVQSGFNQNLALAGGKNAGQNQSKHPVTQRQLNVITSPLAGGASGTVQSQGSLLPIRNLAQVSNPALGTPGVASNQYLMFRDNQTGQVMFSPLPSALVQSQPGGLTNSQSKVISLPPVSQNQGSQRMMQNLLSGIDQQQNQKASQPATIPTPVTSGNVQLQVNLPPTTTAAPPRDQFSAASTLQAISQLMNPVQRSSVDQPARQDTHMSSSTLPQSQSVPLHKTLSLQTESGSIPQTVSLPDAQQNVVSLAPQEQHITPHTGTPPTVLDNSQEEPQPPKQSGPAPCLSESAQKQVDAQQSPSVVQNTTGLTDANLKSLPLPDGTKLVITMDQFNSLKKGNLGNVTGHVLTPLPGSHEKRKKKKSKKDKRHQANLKKKHAKLKKKAKQSKEQSADTSTDNAEKDPLPIKKRKLHTKDISLLPPNIATIQALKSLLFDRKNLEERRGKFMSELEKQLIKSEEADGKQTAHFSGYLEGRKTAQDKTRETDVPPTTLPSAEPGSFNSQEESVISDSQRQPNVFASDSEGPEKTTSPQELVEEHLASLKKTDSYQLLQRRFLSLFLWPGLLSSTRIKGMISVNLGDRDSYDEMPRKPKRVRKRREFRPGGQQPAVKKHVDQSIHKNRNTAGAPSPTCQVTLQSQRAPVGLLQDQSVVEIDGSKTLCSNDQYSENHAPSTSGHCVVKDAAANSGGVGPGIEGGTTNYDLGVLVRGKKRKAEDSPSSVCPHDDDDEDQRMSEEGEDNSGIPQNRRKESESNYTDAMMALAALQNFDI